MTITYGGFISENIRRWIIREAIESGDPENFFYAMQAEVERIEDDMDTNTDFWASISDSEIQ